jgi:hypothetical protein
MASGWHGKGWYVIYRLRNVFAVLNGHCLASLLRSLSSFGVVFRGFLVLWHSFTLPVWTTKQPGFNGHVTIWDGISGRGKQCTDWMKVIIVDSSWWPSPRMETEKHSISTEWLHWIVQQSICKTYHPLPCQPLAISLHLTVFDVPCWIKVYKV